MTPLATMTNLLPLPILVPLLGAGIALMLGQRPRAQRAVTTLCLMTVPIVTVVLLFLADTQGVQSLWVGGWRPPLGIALVADRLSALMLLVASLVTLSVHVFATGQDSEERKVETPVSIFHPTFLILSAGVSNAFLAGDLFNLFVGFEMLLFSSYVLLTLGGTADRIRAGSTYVVVNLLSSSLFLVAISAVYAATGTVNLAQLSLRLKDIDPSAQGALQLVLVTVFGIKAAVFPLSAWLPDSYPTAPAPVTAVFAGLLTKVGVYAILRTQSTLFDHRPMGTLLLVTAILTMLVGIAGAVAQVEIKRILSFTLVSHIGYMVLGIGLATPQGLSGAIFYTTHHITIQTALFLVVGLVERVGGSTSIDKLGRLAAASPLLGALFFVPAMNLAGIPPMSGFVGKLGLLDAAVRVGTPLGWVAVVSAVVTSLLTLYAMAKIWSRAFWADPVEGAPPPPDDVRLPPLQTLTAAAMVAVTLAIALGAGWLYGFTDRAAVTLRDGEYARVVLSEVQR